MSNIIIDSSSTVWLSLLLQRAATFQKKCQSFYKILCYIYVMSYLFCHYLFNISISFQYFVVCFHQRENQLFQLFLDTHKSSVPISTSVICIHHIFGVSLFGQHPVLMLWAEITFQVTDAKHES